MNKGTKLVAGASIGTALAIVLAWAIGQAGIEMPEEVVAAVGVVIGRAAAWAELAIGRSE